MMTPFSLFHHTPDITQVGVGVTVAVRKAQHANHKLLYHRVPEDWRKEEKLDWLRDMQSVTEVKWKTLRPDERYTWLTAEHANEFALYLPIGTKEAKSTSKQNTETIFKTYSLGISSNRDDVVYDFDRTLLLKRIEKFSEAYNAEVDRYKRSDRNISIDNFLDYSQVKWSSTLKGHLQRGNYAVTDLEQVRVCLYRPFCKQYLYYDDLFIDRPGLLSRFFPTTSSGHRNTAILLKIGSEWPMFVLVSDQLMNLLPQGGSQCFPFYVYDEDGGNRRENITDWALGQFREHYGDKKISKWDIFYYVYGILHHSGYRERFADNLKRDLPRIPFADDFHAFAEAGKKLAQLHLDYEKLEPYPLQWMETPDLPLSYRVEKMRLNKEKTALQVNDSLTLAGIPSETFLYRLGNRSALEWIIDQYQVSEDKRSGIKSDPNRPDDEEYIVRLVGQVVRVSIETVKMVRGLPVKWAEATGI